MAVCGFRAYLESDRLFQGAPSEDSIVVLPFANAGGDATTEYLSDGVTESLINNLARLPHLKVTARSAAIRYKGQAIDPPSVAKKLGVPTILIGRVLPQNERLAVSAELVDGRENRHLWGEQYKGNLSDLLTWQEEITRRVSEQLRINLKREGKPLTKSYTQNAEAYHPWVHAWGDGYVQDYNGGSHGRLGVLSSDAGTYEVNNLHGLWGFYFTNDGASAYGYPISNEYAFGGGTRQDFEAAYLTWDAVNGVVAHALKACD